MLGLKRVEAESTGERNAWKEYESEEGSLEEKRKKGSVREMRLMLEKGRCKGACSRAKKMENVLNWEKRGRRARWMRFLSTP